jgi:hypothetical protein
MYFPRVIQYDWKLQTLQDYIIRILQHFATTFWNITNFVMLFQAVMSMTMTCWDLNFSQKVKGPLGYSNMELPEVQIKNRKWLSLNVGY